MRGRAVLALLAAVLVTSSFAEEARGPRIGVDPPGFDFGKVLPNKTVRKEFRLRNLGGAPLVIERISKSCGCTTAATDVSTVDPGESTTLLVEVKTPAVPGTIQHRVLVRSNDPETPSLEIRLRATVVAGEE